MIGSTVPITDVTNMMKMDPIRNPKWDSLLSMAQASTSAASSDMLYGVFVVVKSGGGVESYQDGSFNTKSGRWVWLWKYMIYIWLCSYSMRVYTFSKKKKKRLSASSFLQKGDPCGNESRYATCEVHAIITGTGRVLPLIYLCLIKRPPVSKYQSAHFIDLVGCLGARRIEHRCTTKPDRRATPNKQWGKVFLEHR